MCRHLLVLIAAAYAVSASASTNELKMEAQTRKRLDITAIIQAESDFYDPDTADHRAGTRLQIAPVYRLDDRFRLGTSLVILQDLATPEQKTTFGNAKVSLSHAPISLSEDTMLLLSAGARLPTNVDDRRDKTYNGALVLEPTFLTAHNIAGFTFSTIYGLYLTKNFHTYDRGNNGQSNMDYQVMNYAGVEKYVSKHISLTIDGDYTYANSYERTPRTLFSLGQSLTYEEKTWSITAGHTNGGDALQANGTDYNVKVFDMNTSVIYANLRVVY